MSGNKSGVSRAALLSLLAATKDRTGLPPQVILTDYGGIFRAFRHAPESKVKEGKTRGGDLPKEERGISDPLRPYHGEVSLTKASQFVFYSVIAHSSASTGLESQAAEPPKLPSTPIQLTPRTPHIRPTQRSLIPPARFFPTLQGHLKVPKFFGVDWDSLAASLARGAHLSRLPRQKRAQWQHKLVVLDDQCAAMLPYYHDRQALVHWLKAKVGTHALDYRVLNLQFASVLGGWEPLLHNIPAGTQVLILSDLGQLGPDLVRQHQWAEGLARLRRMQLDLHLICPMPARYLSSTQGEFRGLAATCMNPGSHRQRRRFQLHATTGHELDSSTQADPALNLLLTLVALLRRVDLPLLRDLRNLHPALTNDAGLEARVLMSPDVERSGSILWIKPEVQSAYLEGLRPCSNGQGEGGVLAGLPWQDRQWLAFLALRKHHHGHLNPYLEHEEVLRLYTHLPPHLKTQLESEESQAKKALDSLVSQLKKYQQSGSNSGTGPTLDNLAWFTKSMCEFADHRTLRDYQNLMGEAKRWAEMEHDENHNPLAAHKPWHLIQEGQQLLAQVAPAQRGQAHLAGPFVSSSVLLKTTSRAAQLIALNQHSTKLADLVNDTLELDAPTENLTLAPLTRPHWAIGLSQGHSGLTLTVPDLVQGTRQVPVTPEWAAAIHHKTTPPALPFAPLHQAAKGKQPTLALTQGLDETGVYVDLSVGEVVQRLRYIPPGRFLMGSPDDEDGSFTDEHPQHEVAITQGFWLANTACTQALWWAVMGTQPSTAGKGDDFPVDSVSWHDVQAFNQKLSSWLQDTAPIGGLTIDLPAEAEWEYACRSGTTTPFHWGHKATRQQANFDGQHPYGTDEKGETSQGTKPVKHYQRNDWGLWQMHGNVWEWCKDGPRPYTQDSALVVDPSGASEKDGRRCLRGGSWFSYGRNLRAARRSVNEPDERDGSIGFRFLLRSQAQ